MLRLLVLLISSVSLLAPNAFAWGKFGHVTICEIADRNITPTAHNELSRLMGHYPGNVSFVEACADADRSPRTRPKEHYVSYVRSLAEVTDDDCGATSKCVISAITSDFASSRIELSLHFRTFEQYIHTDHWLGLSLQPAGPLLRHRMHNLQQLIAPVLHRPAISVGGARVRMPHDHTAEPVIEFGLLHALLE